jgi:hypothetical protein
MNTRNILFLGAVWLALPALACSLLSGAPTDGNASPQPPPGSATNEVEAAMEEFTDPRVECVLDLRSVIMEFQSTLPGESPRSTEVAVDSSGNARIATSGQLPEEWPGTPMPEDWTRSEILLIDGKAYVRMANTGPAEETPDLTEALRDLLYDPLSPGFWLILLSEDAFTPSGSESKGGFASEKYLVDGGLDTGKARGTIWVDPESGALIGADLILDESLLDPYPETEDGKVTILFSMNKGSVPPITLP